MPSRRPLATRPEPPVWPWLLLAALLVAAYAVLPWLLLGPE